MNRMTIVVPVYNVRPYLQECLDSLTIQKDTEIICVDDASTDGSRELLKEYAAKHPQVRVVEQPVNQGLMMARKAGAALVRTPFMMYVDSDDVLTSPDAAEKLADRLEETGADLAAFHTRLLNSESFPEEFLTNMRSSLDFEEKDKEGIDFVQEIFSRCGIGTQVVCKAYRSELIRETYRSIPDMRINMCEDLVTTFLIASRVKKSTWMQEDFYGYRLGSGMSTTKTWDVARLRRLNEQESAWRMVREVLTKQGTFDRFAGEWERQAEASARLAVEMIMTFNREGWWADGAERDTIMRETVRAWGGRRVLKAVMACTVRVQDEMLAARFLEPEECFPEKPREVRTIALFYPRMEIGGIPMCLAGLIPVYQAMGLRVVLLLEEALTETSYPVPEDVPVYMLPTIETDDEQVLAARYTELQRILKEEKIDMLAHHAWFEWHILRDIAAARLMGVRVSINTHSVYTCFLRDDGLRGLDKMLYLTRTLPLADVVVAESESNTAWWKHFCPRAVYAPNPCGTSPEEGNVERLPESILWIGRISPEKRTDEAIRIFARVKARRPRAVLRIVGKAESWAADYEKKVHAMAEELGVTDSVRFEGFHRNVADYYKACDVMLMTSIYEGFSLTLGEGKLAGIPAVMYDIPTIRFCEDPQGLVIVPQGAADQAAEAIAGLLEDPAALARLSEEARKGASVFSQETLIDTWTHILRDEPVRAKTTHDDIAAREMAACLEKARARTDLVEKSPDPLLPLIEYQGRWKPLATLTYCLLHWGGRRTLMILQDKLLHRDPNQDPRLQ